MKNRITTVKGNNKISFYLHSNKGKNYLFTQDFTKGVYEYFRTGRSETELYNYKKWNRNPRLDKTIEKLPMYIKYVTQEVLQERGA